MSRSARAYYSRVSDEPFCRKCVVTAAGQINLAFVLASVCCGHLIVRDDGRDASGSRSRVCYIRAHVSIVTLL